MFVMARNGYSALWNYSETQVLKHVLMYSYTHSTLHIQHLKKSKTFPHSYVLQEHVIMGCCIVLFTLTVEWLSDRPTDRLTDWTKMWSCGTWWKTMFLIIQISKIDRKVTRSRITRMCVHACVHASVRAGVRAWRKWRPLTNLGHVQFSRNEPATAGVKGDAPVTTLNRTAH